jgi:hypothetical protein
MRLRSVCGVAAPESVGGEAKEKKDDGDDDVLERGGIVEGEDDGVGNDGCGGEHEEEWSEGVPRMADQIPSEMIAAAGVPKRGWTSASFLKKRLSLAMA